MEDLSTATAVVLAGGLGTRLRSVVADRPKVLADIAGRPFLAYLLDQLAAAGVRKVVLCTGYLGDQVERAFGSSYHGLRILYSPEPSPLGTGGGVRTALPLVTSNPVLVMNGDSFCNADLQAFWTCHHTCGAEATLLLTRISDTRRYGRVDIDETGRVLAFVEKGQADGAGWINAGVYLLNQRLLAAIPRGGAVSLEREVFPAWIGRGLFGYPSDGRFLDIGTPETYAAASEFFAQTGKQQR